jgi:multidrug efflux pump subunit AcrA (membrane-fusion protein)
MHLKVRQANLPLGHKFRDMTASPYAIARVSADRPLFELAEEAVAADQALQAAISELALAERRLQRTELLPGQDLPAWFVAREDAEAAARAFSISLYEQLANVRAKTRAGLAIKLRILSGLYSDDPRLLEDELNLDLGQLLLNSIIDDVSRMGALS